MKKFLASVKSFLGKRAFAVGLVGFAGASAFAEDAAPTIGSEATTALTTWVSGLSAWVASIAPSLVTLLSAIFGITLIFVVYKWVTRGTKKG